jgi:toxin FitB
VVALPLVKCYVSVITLGEIRRGIERLRPKNAAYAELLEHWLLKLEAAYAGRILQLDRKTADIWGRLDVQTGQLIDAQIAATALQHDAILVTRNIKDFKSVGLKLVNPFEAA